MKQVAVGIITQNGCVLACQRKRDARYAFKWEFPGGKLEEGETPKDAVVRELREELKIDAIVVEELFQQDWVYSEGMSHSTADNAFRVSYFLIRNFSGTPVNHAFEQIRWVSAGELQTMDILEGNRKAVEFLVANATEKIQQHVT
jgi:8-oxo-dGTP diphosphatase